ENLELVWKEVRGSPEAVKLRSILQLDLGMSEEARRGFETVVAAHPFDEVAHYKLAEACRQLGLTELEHTHRELSREIQTKRQTIRRILRDSEREPVTTDDCLRLAKLYRELGEQGPADHWSAVAAP